MNDKSCYICVHKQVCSIFSNIKDFVRPAPSYILTPIGENNVVTGFAEVLGSQCLQFKPE